MLREAWRVINEFPDYEVSNLGAIAHRETDYLVAHSRTTQGALKVGLRKDGRQHTRSVKVLVARAFVDGEGPYFNTPIQLDSNQDNVQSDNLMWRPRWFAINYTRQWRGRLPDHYSLGPIIELDPAGVVVKGYLDTIEVCRKNGLLLSDVWESLYLKTQVYPTAQRFSMANEV